jgi:hypothetical protein
MYWELSRATFGCRRKHVTLVEDHDDLRSRVIPHRPNFCRIGQVELVQMQKGRYAAKRGFVLDETFRV